MLFWMILTNSWNLGDLSFDDTQKLENKLQKRFLELFRRKFISKKVYEFIRLEGSQWPRMYGLPKIHKQGIPLRPILSMCHSVQHSLTKWLVEVLNPVLEFYYGFCVKDSFTCSSIIRRFPVCNESQFLVSFDIVSLFTDIPLDETVSICTDILYRGPSTIALPFPEEVFIELMGIATKSVSFSFNESCTARLRVLVWVPLLAPFWLIFLLGSKKDICLKPFQSPSFTYVTWIRLSFPLDHVTMHYYSSINWMSYIHLYHLPWKKKIIINCHF